MDLRLSCFAETLPKYFLAVLCAFVLAGSLICVVCGFSLSSEQCCYSLDLHPSTLVTNQTESCQVRVWVMYFLI